MTQFHPLTDAALDGDRALVFGAIEMELPDRTVRLLDGSARIAFPDGRVFTAEDDVVGVLTAIEELTDGAGDEAPALAMTFTPATDADAASLAAADMQNSPLRLYIGVLDRLTGLVIGDVLIAFDGLLDVATIKGNQTSRTVDYEVTSVFEDFFINNDGALLNPGFYNSIFPNAKGLEFVTSILLQIYWGSTGESGVSSAANTVARTATISLMKSL